jgi:hypothetical protein
MVDEHSSATAPTGRMPRNGPYEPATAAASSARMMRAVDSRALRAAAIGAFAVGAIAIGALAIGSLAIARLAIKRARVGRLEIDELVVHHVRESRHPEPRRGRHRVRDASRS